MLKRSMVKNYLNDSGCASCHRPTLTTKTGVEFHPYSDLLLHDMGDDLQDGRPEFLATEREFRTRRVMGRRRSCT